MASDPYMKKGLTEQCLNSYRKKTKAVMKKMMKLPALSIIKKKAKRKK